jgi:DNA-binding transcriptional MerR regulator
LYTADLNQPKDLLSIGAFASMTRLSIKALRLYDQLDLLQPRHVDSQSGYRYYEVDQLSRARMIRSMRDMDMPLATIRQVLAALDTSPVEAETLVREYASMREKQVEQIRAQVQTFIQLIQQEINPMSLEVNVKNIPTRQVASITRHIKVNKLDATIEQSLAALRALLLKQNASASDVPFGIYHGAINEQEDGPIEICMPVDGSLVAEGDVKIKQLQGGNAACVTMFGAQCDFPAILGAYDAAADWIQKNGYQTAEPPREVWYSSPGENAKMEIVWLFK